MESLLLLGTVGAGQEGGHDVTGLLTGLLILFAAAKIAAEVFERLNQPAVVGEILAGLVVGPQVLKLVSPTEVTSALSELGVIFLLFLVGLETRPRELMRVGADAFLVAVGGVVLPFLLGAGLILWQGGTLVTAFFVGAALVATSVGITARVLSRLGVLQAPSSRIILGAAVIDDILGLLVLAFVSGFARGGGVDYRQVALTGAYAVAFVAVIFFFGRHMVAGARPALERLRIGHSLYLAAIGLCLALSVAASVIGVAAIVGAFLAGVAFSEASEETGLHQSFVGLSEFFVPFFLAGIGMQLDLHGLGQGSALALCAALTLLALFGKFVGCGIPALRRGRKDALRIGVGMMPRGEVGIIVAQLGFRLGVFDPSLFAVIIVMAVASTLVAPPLLSRLYGGEADGPTAPEVSRAAA